MAKDSVALTDKDTIIAMRSLQHEPVDIQVTKPDEERKEFMVWLFKPEVDPIAQQWQRFVNGLPVEDDDLRIKFEVILATLNASKSFQNCWYALIKQKALRS